MTHRSSPHSNWAKASHAATVIKFELTSKQLQCNERKDCRLETLSVTVYCVQELMLHIFALTYTSMGMPAFFVACHSIALSKYEAHTEDPPPNV